MRAGGLYSLCGFIMHCAQDQYVAHVFNCDPSAGALCKTIEAACKVPASSYYLSTGFLLEFLFVIVLVRYMW